MMQKLCMMTGEDEVSADSLEEGSPVLSDEQGPFFFFKYLQILMMINAIDLQLLDHD